MRSHPSAKKQRPVRVENVMNQMLPINLGSPYQGTRYALPIRVLGGLNWQV
jgi:hypothetical protein